MNLRSKSPIIKSISFKSIRSTKVSFTQALINPIASVLTLKRRAFNKHFFRISSVCYPLQNKKRRRPNNPTKAIALFFFVQPINTNLRCEGKIVVDDVTFPFIE